VVLKYTLPYHFLFLEIDDRMMEVRWERRGQGGRQVKRDQQSVSSIPSITAISLKHKKKIYRLLQFVPLQNSSENLISSAIILRGEEVEVMRGHEGSSFLCGTKTLLKEASHKHSTFFFLVSLPPREATALKSKQQPSPDPKIASAVTSNFPASQTVRNKFLFFIYYQFQIFCYSSTNG
jgi:hypothetical protein